jgi:hypothetical protein
VKLDRDINTDGKGKYALVRLRTITAGSEADGLLKRLDELGVVDWGRIGEPDEFFVIKLRDKHARRALRAYATNAYFQDIEYGQAVDNLADRAGAMNPFCKLPD